MNRFRHFAETSLEVESNFTRVDFEKCCPPLPGTLLPDWLRFLGRVVLPCLHFAPLLGLASFVKVALKRNLPGGGWKLSVEP